MANAPLDVSTDDLAKLAGHMRDSATTVANQAKAVSSGDHMFGTGRNGAECEAGRAYVAQGAAIHDGLQHIADWLQHWSDATTATATALGASAIAYGWTDGYNAEQISNADQ
ncbi:hypothetical protein [Nocardia vaccinii]|uniref:hypothetical protein n=1 Tax=Nocardia vaccinii TaxID=1822 RepID=UPI00082BF12C|nr:hypothetical protein [Nocardia vaccinii]